MKLSTRYGLVGIAALATLSLVHWGRKMQYVGPDIAVYLMGVLPNMAAAIAIPFVMLGIWSDRYPNATYAAARPAFIFLSVVAGVGLLAWEFMQSSSSALVFDPHDIGATVVGLGVGWLVFELLTPRANAGAR